MPTATPELDVVLAVRRDGPAEGSAHGVDVVYRDWLHRHHEIDVELRLSDSC